MATQLTVVRTARAAGLARPLSGGLASLAGLDRQPRPRDGTRGDAHAERANERERWLIELYPLVKRVAMQMRAHLPAHVELDELIGAGTQGLMDAVEKFDPARRVKLETYARHRIRGSILDSLRALDPVSRDLRRKHRRVERAYAELRARLGRPVRDEEIASALKVDMRQWHLLLRELQAAGFDGLSRVEAAGSLRAVPSAAESAWPSKDDGPFELCYRREQREILNFALAGLREREQEIMRLYYCQGLTMNQIAERLKVDESRVSQLHSAALARLRKRVQNLLSPPQPVFAARVEPALAA